jgi:hypothetical protein
MALCSKQTPLVLTQQLRAALSMMIVSQFSAHAAAFRSACRPRQFKTTLAHPPVSARPLLYCLEEVVVPSWGG